MAIDAKDRLTAWGIIRRVQAQRDTPSRRRGVGVRDENLLKAIDGRRPAQRHGKLAGVPGAY